VITRSVLFSLKCTRKHLVAGLRPDSLGELKRSPEPLTVLGGWAPRKGGNGKGGNGMGWYGMKGKGGGEGKGREGKGKEG